MLKLHWFDLLLIYCKTNQKMYISTRNNSVISLNRACVYISISIPIRISIDRGYNTIKHCDKTAKTKSTTVDCFSVLALLQLLHIPATTRQ